MNIAEIKQRVMQITSTMTDEVPAITNDIEIEFNKVIAELNWLGQGSANNEIDDTIQDLKQAIVDLNNEKSQVYHAAESLRNYVNAL